MKFNLAVDIIYEAEGMKVDDSDVKNEMELQIQQYKIQNLEYDPQGLREQVLDSFKHVKVIEWLKDTLKRTVIPFKSAA